MSNRKEEKMNKKADGGSVFIIIIISIVILVIIVFAIAFLINNNKPDENNGEVVLFPISMFLKAGDAITGEIIETNFLAEYGENIKILSGNTSKETWTEFNIPVETISLSCWSRDYYLSKNYKMLSSDEIYENKSRTVCSVRKIGDIEIKTVGELNAKENTINFNITTPDNFNKLSAVISWSPGIINAYFDSNEVIMCDNGNWLNYTSINPKTKEYNYIPDNYYRCGECVIDSDCDWAERCQKVQGRECSPFTTVIPNRFIGKVDSSVYFGKSIRNDSFQTTLHIRGTDSMNALDYVEVTFYDKDRRWDASENLLRYMSEQNDINLGNPEDFVVRIPFG